MKNIVQRYLGKVFKRCDQNDIVVANDFSGRHFLHSNICLLQTLLKVQTSRELACKVFCFLKDD